MRPSLVVNAAAYTQVDRAESEPELCASINADAPAILADECRDVGAMFVHFSTDYVFDGTKRTPYVETDEPRPLGVYGRTKHDGEHAVVAVGGAFMIVRTSWVYGLARPQFPGDDAAAGARARRARGGRRSDRRADVGVGGGGRRRRRCCDRLRRERDHTRRVRGASGIYHMTAAGSTTWYDFARRILADDPRSTEQSVASFDRSARRSIALPARRPAYSVLDNTKLATRFGVQLPSWSDQWRATVEHMRPAASADAT